MLNITSSLVTVICIDVLMALSLLIPLALDDFFLTPIACMGTGAYTFGFLLTRHANPGVAIVVALLMATGVAALVGLLAFRLTGYATGIATLGVVVVVQVFFENFGPTGAENGFGGWTYRLPFWSVVAATSLVIVGLLVTENSKIGLTSRAIRSDRLAIECLGVSARKYRFVAFSLSGFISGLAGIMIASFTLYISPTQFGFGNINAYLVSTIIGGSTTTLGPVIGSVITGASPTYFNFLSTYELLVYSILVIVVLLVRKEGILTGRGMRRLKRLVIKVSRALRRHRVAVTQVSAEAVHLGPGKVLEGRGLSKRYGGSVVLDDVSFVASPGEVLGIIGPNGAGKTTLLNVISGVVIPDAGQILVDGERLVLRSPHVAAKAGIARTFQNLRMFDDLTVDENMKLSRGFQTEALLSLTGLTESRESPGRDLPYGAQRRLEIARALSIAPGILILDEPTAGMTQAEAADVAAMVEELRSSNLTIVIIEHNLKFLMSLANKVLVLETGKVIAEGTPEVLEEPAVLEAYFGFVQE